MRSNEPDPLPPYGRHKWMAPHSMKFCIVSSSKDLTVRILLRPIENWEGWHQRSRSLDQLGHALPVSTFGETNDATC